MPPKRSMQVLTGCPGLRKSHAVLFLIGKRIGKWQELEYLEAVRLTAKVQPGFLTAAAGWRGRKNKRARDAFANFLTGNDRAYLAA